jgi:hypothetical protein
MSTRLGKNIGVVKPSRAVDRGSFAARTLNDRAARPTIQSRPKGLKSTPLTAFAGSRNDNHRLGATFAPEGDGVHRNRRLADDSYGGLGRAQESR